MRWLLPLVALLLAASGIPTSALSLQDPGAKVLDALPGEWVERRLVLDLWDQGQPPRSFSLRLAPDSGVAAGVEAAMQPIGGPEAPFQPLPHLRIHASGSALASDRGEDGLYELRLRVQGTSGSARRLAVLVVEEAPGSEALAITTYVRSDLQGPLPEGEAVKLGEGPGVLLGNAASGVAGGLGGLDVDGPASSASPGSAHSSSTPDGLQGVPISFAVAGLVALALGAAAWRHPGLRGRVQSTIRGPCTRPRSGSR